MQKCPLVWQVEEEPLSYSSLSSHRASRILSTAICTTNATNAVPSPRAAGKPVELAYLATGADLETQFTGLKTWEIDSQGRARFRSMKGMTHTGSVFRSMRWPEAADTSASQPMRIASLTANYRYTQPCAMIYITSVSKAFIDVRRFLLKNRLTLIECYCFPSSLAETFCALLGWEEKHSLRQYISCKLSDMYLLEQFRRLIQGNCDL